MDLDEMEMVGCGDRSGAHKAALPLTTTQTALYDRQATELIDSDSSEARWPTHDCLLQYFDGIWPRRARRTNPILERAEEAQQDGFLTYQALLDGLHGREVIRGCEDEVVWCGERVVCGEVESESSGRWRG